MPNAYQKRLAHKQALQHERVVVEREERWLEAIKHCNRYEAAYLALHGRTVNVLYVKGWYLVHNRRYRQAVLDGMSIHLEVFKHMQDNPQPETADD